MFKRITQILLIFCLHSLVSAEDTPEVSLKRAKLLCEKKIREANRELINAKRARNREIKSSIQEYSEAIGKVKVHFTKQGELQKALSCKELQEELLRQSIYEFITSDPVKKFEPKETEPTEDNKVVSELKEVENQPKGSNAYGKVDQFIDYKPKETIITKKKRQPEKVINIKDIQVTMSASKEAPEIDGEDIANFGNGDFQLRDKWWEWKDGSEHTGNFSKGQTFITKKNVYLKGITYQMSTKGGGEPTKSYTVRVCEVADEKYKEIFKGSTTQNFSWNSNEYMTWKFSKGIPLLANTTYSVDILMTDSTAFWKTGIPYLKCTDNKYSEGELFHRNPGLDELEFESDKDRIFHLDLNKRD